MATKTYRCDDCGHEITQDAALPPPECCGSSMSGLPPCDKPHTAESSRNAEIDDACDDGVH
jgi:hypothetical protein